MGSHWLLWMILTLSSSAEGRSHAESISSWNETSLPDILLSTVIKAVTPSCAWLRGTERRRQIEPFQPASEEYVTINISERQWISPPTPSNKSVNNLPPTVSTMESSMNLTTQVDKDVSRVSTSPTPEWKAFKGGDLVKSSHSQQAVPQDLKHYPRKDLEMKETGDRVEKTLKSPACCGSLSSPGRPVPFPTYNNSFHGSRGRASAPDLALVDLVLHLISLTSGRQFYLVYDDVTPGMESVVRAVQSVMGDTMLLSYDPSLVLLKEALTSNYHVHPMRNIFILCSVTHIVNIFNQVREKVLESPTIQWFVIVDEDMTKDLPVLLREGTQVVLVRRSTPQRAHLLSSRVSPDGRIGFHLVGRWSKKHQGKGGLAPSLEQLYSDLKGRQLLVTTNNNWPYFKIKTMKNGTIVPVYGIEVSIMNALGEALNFTYKMTTSPDGNWGGPKADGTITGLIGQVARHEAHATLCELTITDARETVVDFTMPYYLESTTLASLAPKEKNRAFAILSPFTIEVWLYIFMVTVLLGPLLYLVSRLLVSYLGEEDGPHYSLQSFSFNMYRNLVLQGNLIDSHRWSLRFIFFFWYLFCLYTYAMYSGTLTAVLAVTPFEKPINSLYDLTRAKRDGYLIITGRDTNFDATLRKAKSGIYKEVWQLFEHENPDRSFVYTRNMGWELIENHKGVFINALLGTKLEATRRGRHKFYIGRETFFPQGYGIACSSGSPLKDVFSRVLIRMFEVGLVDRWINDEVLRVTKHVPPSGDSGTYAITLQHLQAAFFIMTLGFSASASVFALEVFGNTTWQTIKQSV